MLIVKAKNVLFYYGFPIVIQGLLRFDFDQSKKHSVPFFL